MTEKDKTLANDIPYYVHCPCCGKMINRSFPGTKVYTICKECQAKFYYIVSENGPTYKLIEIPQKISELPALPAY